LEICEKRNVSINLDDKIFVNMRNILKILSRNENDELKQNIRKEKEELLLNLHGYLMQNSIEKYRKRKVIKKELSVKDYSSYVKIQLKLFNNNCRISLFNYIEIESNKLMGEYSHKFDNIRNYFIKLFNSNVQKLFNKFEVLDNSRESMKFVNEIRRSNRLEFEKDFSIDKTNEISRLLEIFKNIGEISKGKEEIKNRMNKINLAKESKLTLLLSKIINDSDISLMNKQIGIEKAILEYDLEWFKQEMESSIEIKNVVLHDIYFTLDKQLSIVLQPYIINKFKQLIKDIDNPLRRSEAIAVLFIIIVGNEHIINICFKLIYELVSQNYYKNEINRTDLIFMIVEKLRKIYLLKFKELLNVQDNINLREKNDLNNNLTVDKKIVKMNSNIKNLFLLLNKNKINSLIQGMDQKDKLVLGDTILSIILKYGKIFNQENKTTNNHTYTYIYIKTAYIHKLAISSINVTQLPMLYPPRNPDKKGNYAPYLDSSISHIYNPFDSIVKNKFTNKFKTENQESLVETISYLNNIKFQINKDVLYFLLEEWNNENSLIFNGLNIFKEINENESKEDKLEKISHNSKYWNLLNCLNIAMLYKDVTFYLPTFAEFRGRIYTLSNYLSYQGGDIARALLLFSLKDSDKKMNNISNYLSELGFEYLRVYFANLAGYSKESWKYRDNWCQNNLHEIIKDFYTDRQIFYNKHLKFVKEPMQYISILLALGDVIVQLKKESNLNISINNPILFDASCSGIQHISAMTRDVILANNVNITSFYDKEVNDVITNSKAEDFYNYAANLIQKELDVNENNNLKSIKLNRELIKRTVMTIPYNISLTGVGEQLMAHFSWSIEGKKKICKNRRKI
jgi:DNA-directed RNA polymerase